MSDSIDAFVQQFQAELFKQSVETFGETFCRRWQNPTHMGTLPDADATAQLKGSCGDSMCIYLKFEDDRVTSASFQTDGCGPSIVCGSLAAELSVGRNPEELLDLSAEDIIARLGTLPEDHRHCAFLAAATVHSATDRYMIQQLDRKPDFDGPALQAPEPPGTNRSDGNGERR